MPSGLEQFKIKLADIKIGMTVYHYNRPLLGSGEVLDIREHHRPGGRRSPIKVKWSNGLVDWENCSLLRTEPRKKP